MSKVIYSDYQISGNLSRTAKKGLLSYISKKDLLYLTDKYFRDNNGILHCAYSGKPILSQTDLELEHIIPVSSGGGTVLFNVVPCLSIYNKLGNKGASNLLDWWEQSKLFKVELLENLIKYILEAYDLSYKQHEFCEEFQYDVDDPREPVSCDLENFNENSDYSNYKKKINYNEFLLSCILKLQNCGVDVSSYMNKYDSLMSNDLFGTYETQKEIQKELLNVFKTYAPEYKYDIVTSIDYMNLLEKSKGKNKNEIILYIKEKVIQIIAYCNKQNINYVEILHNVKNCQSILYDSNCEIEDFVNNSLKYLDDLVETLNDFCIEYGWYPRKSIYNNGEISRSDYTSEELYEVSLYAKIYRNIDRFSLLQKQKIDELKENYKRRKIIDEDDLFEKIIEFTNKNWFPRGTIRDAEENEKESRYETNLYSSYRAHITKFTKKQIELLDKIKEERSYYRVTIDKYYESIVNFVRNNGFFPRSQCDNNEEKRLYQAYLRSFDKFTEEQKENIEQLKTNNAYFDYNSMQVIEEIKKFIKENGRFPVSEVRKNGVRLNANQYSENEKYEVNLYAKYRRSKSRISKDIIEELDSFRDHFLANKLFEEIVDFVDQNGYFPKGITKHQNGEYVKTDNLTNEEILEKRLYVNYASYVRKNKFTTEQLIKLQELRTNKKEYIYRANKTCIELIEFINNYHYFPRNYIWRNNKQLTSDLLTEEELNETRLRQKYDRLKKYISQEQMNELYNCCEINNCSINVVDARKKVS